ncbi:MAG: Sua5/YciO/YrdC/YwlC family protein, partial [Pseudomonadales bacterium]|nr:Sua5/YciO/YrdC/YwlC family protein [Pseudomonadales bacterium]
ARLAANVAPGNPYAGVMLPYTPLHVLVLQALGFPVIATSGNRASEPICCDEGEALQRLQGIADLFLVHDRPIVNRADDSIVHVMAGRKTVLRRGRGYAPLALMLAEAVQRPVLASGGHMKNTVAFALGRRLLLGPHIGDLDTPEACAAQQQSAAALMDLYRAVPQIVAHDAHPDYRSTRMARESFGKSAANCLPVQHHYAHALACLLDNGREAPCFAVVWDGTGYGGDGTIWGGEFLAITPHHYERVAHFLPFPLPGGEAAIRDPRRAALGVLYAMGATERLPTCLSGWVEEERRLLMQAMEKQLNAPLTSSAGRLFDAVAALTGSGLENSFEGEAAMTLEFAALEFSVMDDDGVYDFSSDDNILDWRPMLRKIIDDIESKTPAGIISARFHNTLAAMIVAMARRQDERQVVLSGGCFQNRRLLESAVNGLRTAGFEPLWHRDIPPNDGGIAAGQIMAVLRRETH